MLIKRAIFSQILPWLGEEKIIIIKGSRQTGKTTLLGQIREYLTKQGKNSVYFSADLEENNNIFANAKLFIKYLEEQQSLREKINDKLYVFIDECQYIKNTGLFLKNIFDLEKKNLQLIVTGSSSLEITKNSEFLTGRKIDFYLQHFSFKEFLKAKSDKKFEHYFNIDDIDGIRDFYTLYGSELEQYLLDYLNWGGYPEIAITINQNKKVAILKDIVKTYIEKDVALFLKVENINGFNNLIKILISQIGALLNKDEVSATLGLSKDTVNKYLDILAGTFIFTFLSPFYTNKRKELTKMPKIFIADFGIIKIVSGNIQLSDYSALPGSLIENFVFNELSRSFCKEELFFYRTLGKSEIDFIIKKDNFLTPLEVKFRNKPQEIPLSIKHFKARYEKSIAKSIVLTKQEIKVKDDSLFLPVVVLPFIKII